MVSQEKPPGIPITPVFINYAVAQGVPRVGALARLIHGWTWQAVSYIPPPNVQSPVLMFITQFPIGMGTGAVYVTLSSLKERAELLDEVETVFYFLNIALFLLNSTTLLMQAICAISPIFAIASLMWHLSFSVYPKALRLLTDPGTSIFVPLIVRLSFLHKMCC